ncbi:SoxR reducing system RseC family protein [Caminicella sporogenes]|uniref:SoxR reducing system RseC family protein n=1 Tax=Caminicella sporogenes TaxID=166485 RepID=UPI00254192AD|nr:SoxR reducing system RseC family protein [Caminicella sporogenes]WIF94382.1 SoxR reducing system RseC family protein [Caminicella sporogenes]
MKRTGKVIEIKGNRAKVTLQKHSACGNCGACHIGDENMNIDIDAINEINAKVGDFVEIDLETPNVLMAAFIAYGIPFFTLIFGIFGSFKIFEILNISNKEMYSFIVGFILLVISYLCIKLNETRFKDSKKYYSKITKILS